MVEHDHEAEHTTWAIRAWAEAEVIPAVHTDLVYDAGRDVIRSVKRNIGLEEWLEIRRLAGNPMWADGLATTTLANNWLNMLRGVAFTAPAGTWVKLHTGSPGAAGTANASATTTRSQATYSAASGGAIALSNTPSFSITATETLTDVSVWDASSAGNFLWSAALSTSKSVSSGDTLNLTTLGFSLGALAA